MNGGRSDASTSTDDVKSRPLCLFYFTHPFGVLSPEPPTLAAAPPHIARAFVNMEPVSPFTLWSPAQPAGAEPSDDDYNSASSASRPSYELGNATVHRTPLSLVSVTRTRKCTLDFGAGRDSISSSLFSSDVWFNSSSSCKSNEYPRRLIPYKKILPPLQLPSPKDSSNLSSSDDFWPKKCLNPEKFSLPPIEMPSVKVKIVRSKKCSMSSEDVSSVEGVAARRGARRRLGVGKPRRARPADLRRLLAALMRRALAGLSELDESKLFNLLYFIYSRNFNFQLYFVCGTVKNVPLSARKVNHDHAATVSASYCCFSPEEGRHTRRSACSGHKLE